MSVMTVIICSLAYLYIILIANYIWFKLNISNKLSEENILMSTTTIYVKC